MKIMRSLFHFLGGIYCAIILIAIAVLMVIAGTFIESKTDSHLLAASWTYEHPFFFFLLFLQKRIYQGGLVADDPGLLGRRCLCHSI